MTKASVKLGNRVVGGDEAAFVIAEIGINHNGDLDLCKKLITTSAGAGCEAVKFQKRTVDVVYTEEALNQPRESPFGVTNGDLKRGLEFDKDAFEAIARHCEAVGVAWTASCWDEGSVDFLEEFDPPYYKVSSASLTDDALLLHHRTKGRPIVLSTGMSSLEEIDHTVDVLGKEDLVLLHCTSTYPTSPEELNLRFITTMQQRYGIPIGFSSHDLSTESSVAAVALGACVIEKHVTLDRTLWGSDQSASLEPDEIARLVAEIRALEPALGDGVKRVYESEVPIREKLRRV